MQVPEGWWPVRLAWGSAGRLKFTKGAELLPVTIRAIGTELKSLFQNEKEARCLRFDAAARREEEEYPLWTFDRRATPQQWQRSGNPEGSFLAGAWRRCSSVGERYGYPPSSRLASRPPENCAPVSHFEIGSKDRRCCRRRILADYVCRADSTCDRYFGGGCRRS